MISLSLLLLLLLLLLYCTYYNNIGLPLDTTEEEFIEMMSKYGIIMQDPDTGLVFFSFFFLLLLLLHIKFAVSCHVNDAFCSEIQVQIKS